MSSKKETSASIEMGGVILNPGECIGSYRYEKPIGKGGMADVLLAYDPNGQPMALKVLKASRFRTGRRRFRREFRALAKLRHPNVIQVDSFGDIFGHPYFAMEHIDGTDLHKSIREFRKIPFEDRWRRIEEILIDLTQGLHYIHSRGLVHRDLKPSNVLIDKHGQCKITDFGIVKDLNPDEDLSTTLVGTWAYASPEQISGRPLDNRSDLYSLGIILYAMLTGRRPFAAENMAGYLKLHRDQPPRSPSSFIPEIPTRLEDICLRLLQKSPQDRYQSALEILDALGFHQFTDDPTTEEVAPWIIPSGGRKELNAALEKYLTDLLSQQGNVVQIIGAEGLGKSRIIKDFVEKAKSRDLHTFYCSITPQQGPFVNPIKIASHIATESGDQDLTTSISTLENSDQNLDADLKYQLFEKSREALQKLLEERPQIFVFDDIHNAQPLLLELIQYLQKMLIENDQLPLLLLCSGDLDQPIPSVVHTLERLTVLDISDILEKMCGKDPGIPQLATKLHKETEGIPLFLVEFIYTLIRNGQILHGKRFRFTTPPGKIADMSFDIPPGIRQIAREQHKELSEISRNIVEILAVGGKELDVDIILDSLEEDEDLVLDNLERLEKRGVLSCRYIGMDPWYELARRKYGTIVYEEMNSQRRLSYHRSIAENLESRGSIGVSSAQQIGEHYRLAHEAGKAYQFLATATLRLWDRGLAAECVELLQRATPLLREAKIALPHLEFIETRLKFLKVQANIFQNKGEWHQATKTFRSMLRYAKEIDNWEYSAQGELGLGILALQLNQLDVGERRFEMVLDEAEKRKDKNLILSCLHYMCALAWQKGDLQKCEALAKVGLLRTQKGELSIARAQILLSLSAVLATTGKIKKAGEEMEEAAMIFAKLLRKEKHATLLCNLAEIQIWQGKIGSAINNSKKALDLCQNTMFRSGEAHANLSLAIALYSIGCIDEALPHLNNCIRISKEAHLSDHNISARYWLAKVFIQMNNDQAAEMHTIDAILNCEEGDPERHLLALRALRAIILINQGKKTAAKQLLNIIEPGLKKLPWPRRLETMFHLAKALLLLNERRKAHEIARFVANKAIEIDFWILSLRTHQLLLKINPHDDSAKKQRDIQRIALSKNLPSQYSKHLQSLFED